MTTIDVTDHARAIGSDVGIDRRDPAPANAILAAAVVGIVAIGVLDTCIDPHIRLEPLYLLPVLAVAWSRASRGYGLAVLAASTGLVSDVLGPAATAPAEAGWNAVASLAVYLVVVSLLARLHRALDSLHDLASTDPLTGLLNRRAFHHAVDRELVRRERTNDPLSVVYIDVDRFKRINDGYGHEVGDAALRRVADAARRSVRSTDVVARLGGDEFAICLPNTGADGAARLGHAIARSLAGDIAPPEVAISVGTATTTDGPTDVGTLLALADRAMYATKARARSLASADRSPNPAAG